MEKLCVTIDKTAGAMEALRRALHALDTAHLGEKARADACRALREHEMAALREAADELEELVPQTYWPCRITASCCSTCKARCSRLLCAKIILQTQNGPVPGGCKPRDRAFSLFRRVSVQHTPQRKPQPPPGIFRKAQLFV